MAEDLLKTQVEKDREAVEFERAKEQQFKAQGGNSPWIHLLGQWGGVPGMAKASQPARPQAPSMSLDDRFAMERMRQGGREKLLKLGLGEKKQKVNDATNTHAMNAVMLDKANTQMEQAVKSGFMPGGFRSKIGTLIQEWVPFAGERGKSDAQQTYDSAQLTFADAVLRHRTGAQANEEEIKKTADELFPRNGDSDAAIAAKKRRRTIYQIIIREVAGDQYKKIAAEVKKQMAPKIKTYVKDGKTFAVKGGVTYERTPKGWVAVK